MRLYHPEGTKYLGDTNLHVPQFSKQKEPIGKGKIYYIVLESLSHVHLAHTIVTGTLFFLKLYSPISPLQALPILNPHPQPLVQCPACRHLLNV